MDDEKIRFEAYEVPEPPEQLGDRIMEAVAAERPARSRAFSRRWKVAIAAGAALVSAAGILLYWWTTRAVEPEVTRVIVRRGEAARVVDIGGRARASVAGGTRLAVTVAEDGAARIEQSRGRAAYDVDPGTPFEVVTPAGTVSVLGTRFRVEVLKMKRALQASAAAAAVAVVVTVYQGEVRLENDEGAVEIGAKERARAIAGEAPSLTEEAPGPAGAARRISPRARERLLRAIRAARAERHARDRAAKNGEPAKTAEASPPEPPAKRPPRRFGERGKTAESKAYIQQVVADAKPLLRECYELALLEKNSLAGKLQARFVIVGEPGIGGLVAEVELLSDDGLAAPGTLSECVRETLYSLEFEPPEAGGELSVHYPLTFSSKD